LTVHFSFIIHCVANGGEEIPPCWRPVAGLQSSDIEVTNNFPGLAVSTGITGSYVCDNDSSYLLAHYKKHKGLKGYKIAKRKFAQDLERDIKRDIIYNIVLLCNGDAKQAKRMLYQKHFIIFRTVMVSRPTISYFLIMSEHIKFILIVFIKTSRGILYSKGLSAGIHLVPGIDL